MGKPSKWWQKGHRPAVSGTPTRAAGLKIIGGNAQRPPHFIIVQPEIKYSGSGSTQKLMPLHVADECPIQQRTAIRFAQFTRSYSLTTALAPFTPRVWLTICLCAALPM